MKKYIQHPQIHVYETSDSSLFQGFNENGQPMLVLPNTVVPNYYLWSRKIFFFISLMIYLLHIFLQITFILAPEQKDIVPYVLIFFMLESMMYLHAWRKHLTFKHQKISIKKWLGYATWGFIVILSVITSLFFSTVLTEYIHNTTIENIDIPIFTIVANTLSGTIVFGLTIYHDWSSRLTSWTKKLDSKHDK